MGMLKQGCWVDSDQIIQNGTFVRNTSIYNKPLSDELINTIEKEPGRFHLISSYSCPWSHRVMIMRLVKGLTKVIPLHIAGGKRVQGYPAAQGQAWHVPGSSKTIVHLHELYSIANSEYTGRVTVPILWDSIEQKIISNESSQLLRAFDRVELTQKRDNSITFSPQQHLKEIEKWNAETYQNLSNGVYQAGFAESEQARQTAVNKVFNMLDRLEQHFTHNRFLLGDILSEADLCLFPTLVRFDICYYKLFHCSRAKLVDYPALWAYARELFNWGKIQDTVDFDVIYKGTIENDTSIPSNLLTHETTADWSLPTNRSDLGATYISLRNGSRQPLEVNNSYLM
jgi:putative glutathione S-transferase